MKRAETIFLLTQKHLTEMLWQYICHPARIYIVDKLNKENYLDI